MTMTLPSNMHRVASGVYIVRTQAGFKRALKIYLGESYSEMKGDLEGFPKEYPSIVFFSTLYRGCHYPSARCIPLKELRAALHVADPQGDQSTVTVQSLSI